MLDAAVEHEMCLRAMHFSRNDRKNSSRLQNDIMRRCAKQIESLIKVYRDLIHVH